MAKGGGGTSTQYVESSTSNLPKYAEPYYTSMMGQAQALTAQPYTPYGGERIAGFTPEQQQVQQNILNQQTPGQFDVASQLGTAAGLGSLMGADYMPSQFREQQVGLPSLQNYQMNTAQISAPTEYGAPQMGGVRDVSVQQVNAPMMQGAQTNYGTGNLQALSMAAPEMFDAAQAQRYMSPYAQNVMDVERREAIRGAKQGQLAQDLGAARQGTYGGSRQLLASMERERNLGQQLGDIEARGMQSAYENAQAQFERDRAAGMTTGQQNLQAGLQAQQLGASAGLQTALANLSNEQQAAVNNQAAQLQTQGLNADQALRAALANQGVDVTRGQQDLASQLQTQGLNANQALQVALANQGAMMTTGQENLRSALGTQQLGAQTGLSALQSNQQYNLEAQRLAEQSRQFGAQQGLAGLAQAGQMAQTMGNLGQMQSQMDLARLNQQQGTAAQQQALYQQYLDMQYQDFLRQQQYPMEQLQQYSSLLHGVPVRADTTTTAATPNPSLASQIMGTGLGALGMYRTLSGG